MRYGKGETEWKKKRVGVRKTQFFFGIDIF
jgi:hypothetical protein